MGVFDLPRCRGTALGKIVIQTRKGRSIEDNHVGLGIDLQWGVIKAFDDLVKQRKWELRRQPTAFYNCAGHVWASRRAALLSPCEWELILQDDNYRPIKEPEVCVGDLAIWRALETKEILHVAQVTSFEQVLMTPIRIPVVLSKLGPKGPEVLHKSTDDPQLKDYKPVLEYWTDRPKEG